MLSCSCYDDYDSWYSPVPDDFVKFTHSRRKRCISCGKLIDIGTDCLEFNMWRTPYNWVEENIYDDEVPLANQYMCESCGEIFLNLTDLGYCLEIGHNIKEDLRDYWDMTGFKPRET